MGQPCLSGPGPPILKFLQLLATQYSPGWLPLQLPSVFLSQTGKELWKQFPGCVIADQLSQLPLETCSVSYLIIVRRPFILRSLCTEPFQVDSLLFVASNWLWCPPFSLCYRIFSPTLFSLDFHTFKNIYLILGFGEFLWTSDTKRDLKTWASGG